MELNNHLQGQAWAGAYFGLADKKHLLPDFFMNFPLNNTDVLPNREMVFTATSDATGPDKLPAKTDPKLHQFLQETSEIIMSIKYK